MLSAITRNALVFTDAESKTAQEKASSFEFWNIILPTDAQ